ncbi:MAG: conjugative transfer ATPase [Candidatus Competibacteraceae bacterium]|nr:conjugative transfer ATPase [Candidatus Competibacteraceae bacterium]MCB1805073.1 conjugative transfer ATPase [Candidatus Competibacteraceae bacterium]
MSAASLQRRAPGLLSQLVNRLLGDWPLTGRELPLSEADFRKLYKAYPAFVDYLPFTDYDADHQVFLLDDGVSVGAVFRVMAADLDARSPERLAEFREQLDSALKVLPTLDDQYPTIVQLYLEDRRPGNIADALAAATPPEIRDTRYSQAWFEVMRAHFELMRTSRGIFADERVRISRDESKGWRAIERQLHLCVYRKAPLRVWRRQRRYAPADQLNRALEPFIGALEACGVRVHRIDDQGLRCWLLPWLTPQVAGFTSPEDYIQAHPLPAPDKRGPGFDLARAVLHTPPLPIHQRDEEHERGVWRLGDTYIRYITLQGIDFEPDDGALTTDHQVGREVSACVWDQMPPESILVWTIIPRSQEAIDTHLDTMQLFIDETTSDSAAAAREQVEVAKSARRQHQMIFNVQMGLYLRAPSLAALDERTLHTENVLARTVLRPIPAPYDLLADDQFVRNLPMVYDWHHERQHALRSRLTYTAHLAATLPFFGRSTGTQNPCFVMYRRDGQPYTLNPFHPHDRSRVAHTVLFGPTGSGKSATAISFAMQSMAVNRPRQIIIEKGNSFGLMVDYYRACGLQTRQILFNRGQSVCYAPYVDTAKALAEHRGELADAGDEDDQRSYLAEMLYMTELMITGGRTRDIEALTSSDRSAMQDALIAALETSEQAGQAHARPQDVYQALLRMSEAECIPDIQVSIRRMADSLKLWTDGLRGQFFNGFSEGFQDADDVVHIDLGILTANGNEDMLALAVLSLIANITAWGEQHQASGRHLEVWFDEGHYVSGTPLTVKGFIVGTKVWRKLNTWLIFATQDFSDFSQAAKKILSQAEFWFLLSMDAAEARQVAQFRDLSAEEQRLLTMALKEPGRFVEGVMLSVKHTPALLRFVPPALALALAQTEGDEKNRRLQLIQQHQISELEAALIIAADIHASRRQHGERQANGETGS